MAWCELAWKPVSGTPSGFVLVGKGSARQECSAIEWADHCQVYSELEAQRERVG